MEKEFCGYLVNKLDYETGEYEQYCSYRNCYAFCDDCTIED